MAVIDRPAVTTELDALVSHLLSRRHLLPKRCIIYCLALHQAGLALPVTIRSRPLAELMGITRAHVSIIMAEMRKHGLVDYHSNFPESPGYVIHRIGPAREGRR